MKSKLTFDQQFWLLWCSALAVVIGAILFCQGCAGFHDARALQPDTTGYCFHYLTKKTGKEIIFCGDSKLTCEGMRRNTHNAGFKVTSECSLY